MSNSIFLKLGHDQYPDKVNLGRGSTEMVVNEMQIISH